MVTDSQIEPETRFAVGWAFDVPDLRDVVARAVRQPEQIFTTSYFDTPDLRLWSRGIVLRHRSGSPDGPGTWTVKLPEIEGGPALARQEISWPGVKKVVPAGASDLLRALIRRADLGQLVQMKTTRLRWTLLDDAENQLGELDYDDVTVAGGGRDGLRYRQIEIERSGEDTGEGALAAVAETLRRAGAEPDEQPKLAKALGLSAEGRDRRRKKTVRPSTAADIVRYAVSAGLERLLDHDYRLRLRSDNPESRDVHQARVATRRLRSDLKTLRALLDPIWLAHTEDELRWLGAVLGAVRDADVMDLSLKSTSRGISTGKRQLGMAESAGLAELRTKLAAERADAVTGLDDALRSQRYLDLLDRLHAAATDPPLTSDQDHPPRRRGAAEMMPKAVNKRWRKIKKKVAAAGGSPSDRETPPDPYSRQESTLRLRALPTSDRKTRRKDGKTS